MKLFFILILILLAVPLSRAQTPAVVSFTLINADDDQDLLTFSNSGTTTVNLADLPTRNLNIRANTSPKTVGSVKSILTGPLNTTNTDNTFPYALFGENNGDYNGSTFVLGRYSLKATPYQKKNGSGKPGTSLTITFEITDNSPVNQVPVANAGADQIITSPATSTTLNGSGTDADGTISGYSWSQVSGPNTAGFSSTAVAAPTVSNLVLGDYVFSLTVRDNQDAVSAADQVKVSVVEAPSPIAVTSFTLVNADNEQDLLTFSNTSTTTINLADLPTQNLNIRANTSPSTVGSVKFILSGTQSRTHTENAVPYALFADNSGNYNAWTPPVGPYTLKASPYPSANGAGTVGSSLTISFQVTNQLSNRIPVANAGSDQLLILPATSTTLNGSGTDADGTISGYNWSQVSGPNTAGFSSTDVAAPTVSNLVLGDYVFSLTVRDNQDALSTPDQVLVSVVETSPPPVISGELKKWHRITITFTGPATDENDTDNPFLNYRLNVTFSKEGQQMMVPGYYAADGNAGESGATAGNKWRVHFTPNETGTWTYAASFRTGTGIAANSSATAGNATAFDGITGILEVGPSGKTGADFRAKGRLRYNGQHFLQFAETGGYFVKGGADSPENFLAYQDFDATYGQGTNYIKTYSAHLGDWAAGNPTWKDGKGKGIIGALNYLAAMGMNSVYFLTMNVNGDGKDVWPWTSPTVPTRYDISKLDQWEVVFSHMDQLGIMMHVVTQETENDQLLDGGELGEQRKLYYRELIARFGHHLAITWNLGEETSNTDAQRKAFADYIKQVDPYKSFISVHTNPDQLSTVYTPLLGYTHVEGASLQIWSVDNVHQETLNWLNQSAASGHKWVVNLDEIGPPNDGVVPDANDFWHDQVRKKALWGNLMAGGGGVEWYFGYAYPHSDLTAQDWRTRDHMWDLTRYALQFFQSYLPFWLMKNTNSLTASTSDYCLSLPGEVYAIYLPNGGTTTLNVGEVNATYQIEWYNPRTGGALQTGSMAQVSGSGNQEVGNPPSDPTQDWVCLVTKVTSTAPSPATLRSEMGPGITAAAIQAKRPEVSAPTFRFFPNPFTHQTAIQVDLPEEKPLEISVTDLLGNQLLWELSPPVKKYSKVFDGSHLRPGIYLLQLKAGNHLITRRIIKF